MKPVSNPNLLGVPSVKSLLTVALCALLHAQLTMLAYSPTGCQRRRQVDRQFNEKSILLSSVGSLLTIIIILLRQFLNNYAVSKIIAMFVFMCGKFFTDAHEM